MIYIDQAPTSKATCKKCHEPIVKGEIRVIFEGYRQSSKMCVHCLKSSLAVYGLTIHTMAHPTLLTKKKSC